MILVIKTTYIPSWVRVQALETAGKRQVLESKNSCKFRDIFRNFQNPRILWQDVRARSYHSVNSAQVWPALLLFKPSSFVWRLPPTEQKRASGARRYEWQKRRCEMERNRRKLNWVPGFPYSSYGANDLSSPGKWSFVNGFANPFQTYLNFAQVLSIRPQRTL